jgi:DNA-binding CsgD family transcriptional regulator
VIGRTFSYELLRAVVDLEDEALLNAVDEAGRAHLLSSGPQGLTFAHELVRQTLLGQLSLPRRQRLHLRAGEALEAVYSLSLEQHLAELADHFQMAGAAAPASKTFEYSSGAGDAARLVFAWDQTVHYYQTAIESLEASGIGDDARGCDLRLDLAAAMLPAGQPRRAVEAILPEAFALAEALGDSRRASRSSVLALEALHRFGALWIRDSAEWREWSHRLDAHAAPGTAERVIADVATADTLAARNLFSQAAPLYERALALARRLDNADALIETVCQRLGIGPAPGDLAGYTALADEFWTWPVGGTNTSSMIRLLLYAGWHFLDSGDAAKADDAWRRLTALATQTRDTNAALYVLRTEIMTATLQGKLEAALDGTNRLTNRAGPASRVLGNQFASTALIWLARYLGRPQAAYDMLPSATADSELVVSSARVFLLSALGRLTEARELLRQVLGDDGAAFSLDAGMITSRLVYLLEAAVILEDRRATAFLAQRLEPAADAAVADTALTSVARHLGTASTLLHEPEAARNYYHRALEISQKVQFRPEVALTRLQLGELLLKQYPRERAEAIRQLDLAIPEFEAMGMQPALSRALRLRGRRRPRVEAKKPRYPDGLSEREVELLRLIAMGKSNQQIAEELVISVNTVTNHITNIFNKSGSTNRTEAAAYAHKHGLI